MIIKNWALLTFSVSFAFIQASAQISKPDIPRIFDEAQRLYSQGSYLSSLEYLKKEAGEWIDRSDTLMYMKIKDLENLYRTDFILTKDIEATLQRFFSRVNKNTFPELRYSEITTIFTTFQSFREKDKAFLDSVSKVTDLNNTPALVPIKEVTQSYLKNYPNSYFSKQLNEYIVSINAKLSQIETARKKKEKDSINKDALKKVGKTLVLNLSFSVPSGGKDLFTGAGDYDAALSFYKGLYTGSLGEKYSLGASLAEAFINISSSPNVKFGLNWNLFDVEYTVFDWNTNSYMSEKQSTSQAIKELKSIKAGTRIGPNITILATRSIAVSFYYSARPGIQFLTGKTYFSKVNGTGTSTYEAKPILTNFNFSNEIGVKFFFFKRLFVSPYFHFGKYNWQNEISEVSTGGSNSKIETQADYDFKFIGLRIGF